MFRTTMAAVAAAAGICAFAVATEPMATASPVHSQQPGAPCGIDLAAPAVTDAVATLPPDPATQAPWSTNPESYQGNFDPCATLSTAIVPIEGATGSSPEQALMFHQGEYVGTATPEPHGFTTLDAAASTDDTVVLDYKTPGSCNACPDETHTPVAYQWDGQRVVPNGQPPS